MSARGVPLWPLVQVHAGELLLHAGVRGGRAGLSNLAGAELRCDASWGALQQALAARPPQSEILRGLEPPEVLGARLAATTRGTLAVCHDAGTRLDELVERPALEEFLRPRAGGGPPLRVLVGPRGAGKTALLARHASRCLDHGEPVLFVRADRLAGADLPVAIARACSFDGPLEALWTGPHPSVGAPALLIDGLPTPTRESWVSLLGWVERTAARIPVVLACSREDWWVIEDLDLVGSSVQVEAVGGLTRTELLELALRVKPDCAPRAAAVEYAQRLSVSVHEALRRPGLAVPRLRRLGTEAPPVYSPLRLLDEQVERDVLRRTGGRLRHPGRVRVVRALVEALAAAGRDRVPVEAVAVPLLTASGARSADYAALLAAGVLVEQEEDWSVQVGFATRDARAYCEARIERASWSRVPQVRVELGAHLVLLLLERGEAAPPTVCPPRELWAAALELDTCRLSSALHLLEDAHLPALVDAMERLLDAGDARLARALVQRLWERRLDPALRTRCLRARMRASYELDDYGQADEILAETPDDLLLLSYAAQIDSSRGRFRSSADRWRDLVDRTAGDDRADNLAGLGQALAGLGHLQEARVCLEEAIATLAVAGPSRRLAEAWSDLGDVHLRRGDADTAESCFEESLALGRQLGSLVGQGIVSGYLGEVSLMKGELAVARRRLDVALEVARRTGNTWREAWTLLRLARVAARSGDATTSRLHRVEGARLFASIGVDATRYGPSGVGGAAAEDGAVTP